MNENKERQYSMNVTIETDRPEFMEIFRAFALRIKDAQKDHPDTSIKADVIARGLLDDVTGEPYAAQEPSTPMNLTLDDLRIKIAESVEQGHGRAVRLILERYAEDKIWLNTVPESRYVELYKEIEKLDKKEGGATI